MNIPRFGSVANAWTDVIKPDRTIKVPTIDIAKAIIDNKIHQFAKDPLFSITKIEWNKAVVIIHGINEAFSTGSQNQKPPHPNS